MIHNEKRHLQAEKICSKMKEQRLIIWKIKSGRRGYEMNEIVNRTLYLECYSGISGDMMAAALLGPWSGSAGVKGCA